MKKNRTNHFLRETLPLVGSFILIALLGSCSSPSGSSGNLVSNLKEFKQAVSQAQPGDRIVMANGRWENVELVFQGAGTEENPIYLEAETPGQVLITGQSNLRMAGTYLEVSGLVFKEGYTPTSEVISFKKGKALSNHCRVSNCVIDNFNNPERFDSDYWVGMYGKNNRFDHNSLIGKRNQGVTMAVRLNREENQENSHIIEYNYFGPRQILGSNGGETLRIGTSHYSKTYSNTLVRNNFFDRCNGEHEIISNKSCGNRFLSNVFFECQGTLTMRHGHHTWVENNYFLGNRKPNTGGIRIINEYQTVKKNYLAGLTGHRFRGALVIMNGVPNSPINRYNQVVDSKMDSNLVINSDYIQLCAGSDEERSAVPVGSTFSGNILLSQTNLDPFTIYDDVSGIEFAGNKLNHELKAPFEQGFSTIDYQLEPNEQGLLSPSSEVLSSLDMASISLPVQKDETGAIYYPKVPAGQTAFQTGSEVAVAPGTNTLIQAIEQAQAGDILRLEAGQEYLMTKFCYIGKPLSIVGDPQNKPTILSEKSSFFRLENGGSLELQGIAINGKASPDQAGNQVVSTSKYAMNQNYRLYVRNCEVKDLTVNHSFDFLKSYKHTFADSILFEASTFSQISGSILKMTTEVEDLGIYNVENIDVLNCKFEQVQGVILDVYRGGTDESTFGPIVNVKQTEFISVGKGKRNKSDASLRFHGVQKLMVDNCQWQDAAPLVMHLTNGEPIANIQDCRMDNTPKIQANNEAYQMSNIAYGSK